MDEKTRTHTLNTEERHLETQGEDIHLKSQILGPEETNPTDILILDFYLQNSGKINVCCLIHPVCGTLLW